MIIESHDLRRVAVEGEVSPETVMRYLEGLPVRGLSRVRIERALAKLGIEVRRPRRRRKQRAATA